MRTFVARLVVLVCSLAGLAAGALIGEGYLWRGYGLIAAATIGALVATASVPHDEPIFGALFATLVFGSISRYEPLTAGITPRHLLAAILAASVFVAFVTLSPRLSSFGSGRNGRTPT